MSSLSNLSEADRKRVQKRKKVVNKTLENRIRAYLDTLREKDPVTVFEVSASLRSKFYDYGRLPESKIKKEIEI